MLRMALRKESCKMEPISRAQILKVGHHGSSSSSSAAFLARVDPEVAVIEVGAGNQYHHPTNATLANLTAVGARIYRTDLNGTVVITTDGTGYRIALTPRRAFPEQTRMPTDPDSDGLYEDLNGNGRKDFDDVVIIFKNLEWIKTNNPIECFDFNGNGRIDFDDIVRLFREV